MATDPGPALLQRNLSSKRNFSEALQRSSTFYWVWKSWNTKRKQPICNLPLEVPPSRGWRVPWDAECVDGLLIVPAPWKVTDRGSMFLPPGRKPYPRNTFFWASSCSSLCFDPGVMSILTASVHTSHMLAPWKRSCSKCYAMHWMSLHTSHMLAPWKHSCSKCYGMDCLGTYFTHAQT